MKKIMAAIVSSVYIAVLCGCGNSYYENGSIVPAESFETVEYGDFSFKLRDGFQLQDDSSEKEIHYIFDAGEDIEFFIAGKEIPAAVPEVINCYYDEILCTEAENKETEVLRIGDFDAACFSADGKDILDNAERISIYTVNYCDTGLTLVVGYPEKLTSAAREITVEIIESAEYTGNYVHPTEEQEFGNEFVSIIADPKWYVSKKSDDKIKLKYFWSDSLSEMLSYITIDFYVNDIYDMPAEFMQNEYERKLKGISADKISYIREPFETEMFGCKAVGAVYEHSGTDLFGSRTVTKYFAENDGMFFSVEAVVMEYDGAEEVRKDIEELLSNISPRKITEERLAELKSENIRHYETEHFRYDVPSVFKFYDDAEYPHFTRWGESIYVSEKNGDDLLSANDWKAEISEALIGIGCHEGYSTFEINGRKIHYLSELYDDNLDGFISDKAHFMLESGNEQLMFTFHTELSDRDDIFNKRIIMEFLESIEEK